MIFVSNVSFTTLFFLPPSSSQQPPHCPVMNSNFLLSERVFDSVGKMQTRACGDANSNKTPCNGGVLCPISSCHRRDTMVEPAQEERGTSEVALQSNRATNYLDTGKLRQAFTRDEGREGR